jgi:hypothetical protein
MEVEKEVMGGSRGGGRKVEGEERNERGKADKEGRTYQRVSLPFLCPFSIPYVAVASGSPPYTVDCNLPVPAPVPHCFQLRLSSTERHPRRDIQERKNWSLSTSCKTGKWKTGLERLPPAASMTRNTGRMSCRIQDLRGGDQSAARKE